MFSWFGVIFIELALATIRLSLRSTALCWHGVLDKRPNLLQNSSGSGSTESSLYSAGRENSSLRSRDANRVPVLETWETVPKETWEQAEQVRQRAISPVSGTNVNLFLFSGRMRSDPYSSAAFGARKHVHLHASCWVPQGLDGALSGAHASRGLSETRRALGSPATLSTLAPVLSTWLFRPMSSLTDFVIKGATECVLDTVSGVIHHKGEAGNHVYAWGSAESQQGLAPTVASANAAAWNEPGFATISSSSVVCVFVLLCSLGTY